MEDMTILHLSDLHINNQYSNTWEYFFKDLANEIKIIGEKRIVVVVTGDIIHKGILHSESTTEYENALSFFRELKKTLGEKFAGIYIVPGNHDKARTSKESLLISGYRKFDSDYNVQKSKFCDDFYKHIWQTHLESYGKESGTGYLELVQEVYELFGMSEDDINKKQFITDTYGVDVIDIGDRKFCFILFNTAWSCIDDYDDRNLICGKFQIAAIKKQFGNLFSKGKKVKPDVTIALGHHPIDSLYGKERDYVFNEMISIDGFNANMYLCGHVHDEIVKNWSNNRHSMNSFVTGFGWPDNGGDHVAKHTYAMYTINIEANAIDVYMRKSTDGGVYIPDFDVYIKNREEKINNKISFPLNAHKTITYIDVDRGKNRSTESHFLSNELLRSMKEYNRITSRFSYLMARNFEYINDDIYDDFSDEDDDEVVEKLFQYLYFSLDKKTKLDKDIKALFDKDKSVLYSEFWIYLSSICQNLVDSVSECLGDDAGILRTHFRYYNEDTEEYEGMSISVSKSKNVEDYQVAKIKYGQLIEAAHKCGKGLVFSANTDKVDHELNKRWTNFITIVPEFEGNNYHTNYSPNGRREKTSFPYITFGVTVNGKIYDDLLYLMDFFSIKDSIEAFIDNYLDKFPIDVGDFCRWIKERMREKKDNGKEN